MKLGHSKDEIKCMTTEGTIALYLVTLDGEPTMLILCDSADPEKAIKVAPAALTAAATLAGTGVLTTAGRFTMTSEIMEGPNGEPLGVAEPRVSEHSVYTYVVPRLHVLLGRLLRAAA